MNVVNLEGFMTSNNIKSIIGLYVNFIRDIVPYSLLLKLQIN